MNDDTASDWRNIRALETPIVMATANQTAHGDLITPLKRISTYASDDWEVFIEEWVDSLLGKYRAVQRFTGSGDKGVDVAGLTDRDDLLGIWDNFQCKHYSKLLSPSDIYKEIGKCLWYAFREHFVLPREYVFVAPKGVSTATGHLLSNSKRLKSGLEDAWAKTVSGSITSTQTVHLNGDFSDFVNDVDFRIFVAAAPKAIIEQHRTTPYFVQRFGGGLGPRPLPENCPEEITEEEAVYTRKLFSAYADHSKMSVGSEADLRGSGPLPTKLRRHLKRSREAFYSSESLRVFVRNRTVDGTFESLQSEVLNGVLDMHDTEHNDGYARVVAVTDTAQSLNVEGHALAQSTLPTDLRGICHQLANDDKLDWTPDA